MPLSIQAALWGLVGGSALVSGITAVGFLAAFALSQLGG